MVEYDTDRLREFAEAMIGYYNDSSILGEVARLEDYVADVHGSAEFVQVGERIELPKRFFSPHDNYLNDPMATDLARSVVLGERDYLLERLNEFREDGIVDTAPLEEFTIPKLLSTANKIRSPTDIFIPMKGNLFKQFHREAINYPTDRDGSGNTILDVMQDEGPRVRWVPEEVGLDYIYLIDKNWFTIIQKRFGDSEVPNEIDLIDDFSSISEEERLMIYLGNKDLENFDLLFRSVFYIPEPHEYGVGCIDISDIEISRDEGD